jgi:hypothetical protein
MKASSAATASLLATEMVLTVESQWEIPTASHVRLKISRMSAELFVKKYRG